MHFLLQKGKLQALALVDPPVLPMCLVRFFVVAIVPSLGRLEYADEVVHRMLGNAGR